MPETTQDTDFDVIIIGGAAAGLTAALYSARRTLRTLVVTKALGGQLAMTPSIENYPGTKQTGGIDLMMSFLDHAQEYGAQIAYETVTGVAKDGDIFTVTSTSGTRTARVVILAFGLTPKNLEVPGEQELQGRGVTYCATCDAPLFKNKSVAVVGGTYEALDAAMLLKKMGCAVTLVHDKPGYPQQKDLFEKVQATEGITVHMSTKVLSVEGVAENKVTGLVIAPVVSPAAGEAVDASEPEGEQTTVAIDGVFVEKGHRIDSEWLGDMVEYGRGKTIVVNEVQETKTPGLFAAGDVTPQRDKQVIVSAGAGATAALSAYAYIQKSLGKPAVRVDWKHEDE